MVSLSVILLPVTILLLLALNGIEGGDVTSVVDPVADRPRELGRKPKVLKCSKRKPCSSISAEHKCKKDKHCAIGHVCKKDVRGNGKPKKFGTCECANSDCRCEVDSAAKVFGRHVNVQRCAVFNEDSSTYEKVNAASEGCGCKYPLFTMADGSCQEKCVQEVFIGVRNKVTCPGNLKIINQVHCQKIYNVEPTVEVCASYINKGCGCPDTTELDLETMTCVCKDGTPIEDVNKPQCGGDN